MPGIYEAGHPSHWPLYDGAMDENPYQAFGGDGSRPRPPDDWRRAARCIMVVAATAALSVIAVFVSAMARDGLVSVSALLVGCALAAVAGLMFVLSSPQR